MPIPAGTRLTRDQVAEIVNVAIDREGREANGEFVREVSTLSPGILDAIERAMEEAERQQPTYLNLIDEVLIEQYPQLADKKRERP